MRTDRTYTTWTKAMYQHLAWRLFQEIYGMSEWYQEEQKHIADFTQEAGERLSEQQCKVIENRVRRLKDEYEEQALDNLKERHWHEFHDEDDEWDEDGFDFIRASVTYDQQPYELWKEAARKRMTVSMVYDSTTSGVSTRMVDPYASRAPYGEGYCHKRKEVRKFRFDRVIDIRLTDKTFIKPKDWKS